MLDLRLKESWGRPEKTKAFIQPLLQAASKIRSLQLKGVMTGTTFNRLLAEAYTGPGRDWEITTKIPISLV